MGNIINVIMEEGVFRGLFLKLTEEKLLFLKSCIFSSLLFGFWHILQPLRNFFDSVQSLEGAITFGIIYIIASTLIGIQYCMLEK